MRIIAFLSVLAILTVAGALLAQSQATTSVQPVGTISQLMLDIIYPTSNDLFYIYRKPPETVSEWDAMAQSALTLAESGNLMMIGNRARDQENWIKDARLLVEVGAVAYKAAKAKDADAIMALNEQLNTACTTCHQDYRPDYRRR